MCAESFEGVRPNLQERIFQIGRLKAMPQVVWQLMGVLRDESSTPRDVRNIVESDPALASKILSLANSAYYGLSQKVSTIERAVVVIGFQELILLSLGAGLSDVFDMRNSPKEFDGQGLWLHSLAVSWAAREMAKAAGHPSPEEVMVAGLLHDLGKLVLATQLTDEFGRLLLKIRQGAPYWEAEEAMGLDHSLIGYWLACRWSLPDIHTAVIRDHHRPNPGDPHCQASALTALADVLVKTLEIGIGHQARPIDEASALAVGRLSRQAHAEIAKRAATVVPAMVEAWLGMLGR